MTTAQTARRPILDAIARRLESINNGNPGRLSVYRGEVPGKPPLMAKAGTPDPAGRVAPYAVIYSGGGRPDPNPGLEHTPGDFLWSGQITFAAGFLEDLLAVLDVAVPLLNLWVPEIDGLDCGALRPPPGVDPGPARRDDDVKPPRFYVPTLWQLHVVTA